MSKTILALGCSNSSGAELSDSLQEDYWLDQLKMDDPWDEWFHYKNAGRKHKEFMSRIGYKENWEYNRTNAWPYRLQEITDYNVYSGANPGTGIQYVKWLYNLDKYGFAGTEPDLFKTTEGLVMAWNEDKILPNDMLGYNLRLAYKGMNRFEVQDFYRGITQPNSVKNSRVKDKFIEQEKRNAPQGATVLDHQYGPVAPWKPKEGESFKDLVDNADVLLWQITSDEPRLLITHPNLPWAFWIPKLHQTYREDGNVLKQGIMSCVRTSLDVSDLRTQKERDAIEETWEREADKLIEYYANAYDYDNHLIDTANFVTSIALRRKQKGLKTIIFFLEEATYNQWQSRLNYDDFICFHCGDVFKVPTRADYKDIHPKEIKRRLREESFPWQKFGHISKWANKQVVNKILERIDD